MLTTQAAALRQIPMLRIPSTTSGNALRAALVLTVAYTLFLAEAGFGRPAQAASAGTTSVALGAVSSPPKRQVMVPVFLTPGTPVGSFSAEIRFARKGLLFVRAEKGFLLDSVNATFRAVAEDDASKPGQSVIRLEVSTGGETPKALREGLVLSLVFRVEADAEPDTTVKLVLDRLTAATPSTPPRPVTPLVGREGTVEILRPDAAPYVGCFFFTH